MEVIESYLDEHLIKTQTMRGSPYFKPFEREVLGWEAQLTRIQDTISKAGHHSNNTNIRPLKPKHCKVLCKRLCWLAII